MERQRDRKTERREDGKTAIKTNWQTDRQGKNNCLKDKKNEQQKTDRHKNRYKDKKI